MKPPKRTDDDYARAAIKGLVSVVPVIGGPLAEFYEQIAPSPYGSAVDEWRHSVSVRLDNLEQFLPADEPFSEAALKIAEALCKESENGLPLDPILYAERLRQEDSKANRTVAEAISDLKDYGLIRDFPELGASDQIYSVAPEADFFVEFDRLFMGWQPKADVLALAKYVYEHEDGANAAEMAEAMGWRPRRLNPALSILCDAEVVLFSRELQPTWYAPWVRPEPDLARFIRSLERSAMSHE